MSLFEYLVAQALRSNPVFRPLQPVLEKELLHHDILREMSHAGLLHRLTFFGGTCLRACYGSNRLSEDLDFTGGSDFIREQLDGLGEILIERLSVKYGLKVEVSKPLRESGNVDTWKLKIITRPEQKNLPAQRINIDVCSVPSYDRKPLMLKNYYGMEMGTSGLIVQAESREEILADKFVALAFRPNRIKNRDLWDIVWLKQQGVQLPYILLPKKIGDFKRHKDEFLELLNEKQLALQNDPALHAAFVHEMRRFLPAALVRGTVENTDFWKYLTDTVVSEIREIGRKIDDRNRSDQFQT